MERVVALEAGAEALAVPFGRLAEPRIAHVEVGGESLVVFWAPGTASALDEADLVRGRDVGASAVFRREVEGRRLTFRPAGDGRFRDGGSVWTLLGEAVEGPLAGRRLTAVPHGNQFWFAWAAFRPETEVGGG